MSAKTKYKAISGQQMNEPNQIKCQLMGREMSGILTCMARLHAYTQPRGGAESEADVAKGISAPLSSSVRLLRAYPPNCFATVVSLNVSMRGFYPTVVVLDSKSLLVVLLYH